MRRRTSSQGRRAEIASRESLVLPSYPARAAVIDPIELCVDRSRFGRLLKTTSRNGGERCPFGRSRALLHDGVLLPLYLSTFLQQKKSLRCIDMQEGQVACSKLSQSCTCTRCVLLVPLYRKSILMVLDGPKRHKGNDWTMTSDGLRFCPQLAVIRQ